MLYGDNGILNKAKYASEEYKNATEEEKEQLAKVDSEIQSSRETVTISEEEYESLKPKSITADSILMTSTNNNLNVGTLNLSDFTNDFTNNFENYFTYDNATGDLTCKKDGWYCINLRLNLSKPTTWTTTYLSTYINDIEINKMFGCTEPNCLMSDDANSMTIFIKKGDIIGVVATSMGIIGDVYNNRLDKAYKI